MSGLRRWTSDAALSVVDQGLASIANFGLSVYLARVLFPEGYGAFSWAFSVFLVASSVHSALLLEPMSVLGPARHREDLPGYLRRVMWNHFAVTAVLAAVILIGAAFFRSDPRGPALAAMALSCPLVLLFWAIRKAYYLETRPDLAALASALYMLLLGAFTLALAWMHRLTPVTAFLALAAAGGIAGLYGIRQLGTGVETSARRSAATRRELWDFGKWLLPSALFFPLVTQIQLWMTAAFMGLADAGVLKALQNPILPVIQVVTALSTLAIPVLARDFGEHPGAAPFRKGLIYTAGMTATAMVYEVLVLATGNLWDRVLYGGRYAQFDSLMPLLGLVPIATAVATGCSVMLRAIQRPELTTITHICGGVTGVVASYFLIRSWHLPGAVYALVVSNGVTALVSVVLTARARVPVVAEPVPTAAGG